MKRVLVDGFELGDPGASLTIAVSSPEQHRDLDSFLGACGASAHPGVPAPPTWSGWAHVAAQLQEFANITLPHPSRCRASLLFHDDWNHREVAVCADRHLVWYRWQTES